MGATIKILEIADCSSGLNLASALPPRKNLIYGRKLVRRVWHVYHLLPRITYNDPCQIARNGGVMDDPRYILSHLTDDYREMAPDPKYNLVLRRRLGGVG